MPHAAESVIEAGVAALEYHEAAWDAQNRELSPPDASALSGLALEAIVHYESGVLPLGAREAVEREVVHRFGGPRDRVTDAFALAAFKLCTSAGGTTGVGAARLLKERGDGDLRVDGRLVLIGEQMVDAVFTWGQRPRPPWESSSKVISPKTCGGSAPDSCPPVYPQRR